MIHNLLLNHVLHLDLNSIYDSQLLWKNNSILFLNTFDKNLVKNQLTILDLCEEDQKLGESEESGQSKSIMNQHDSQNLEIKLKENPEQQKPKKSPKSFLFNRYKKKIISNFENFDFNLIRNKNRALEILILRKVEHEQSIQGKRFFMIELMTMQFNSIHHFQSKQKYFYFIDTLIT